MAWRTIPDSEVDPEAPILSSTGYALRDNLVATAEGLSGAPRVEGRALAPVVRYASGSGSASVSNLDDFGGIYVEVIGWDAGGGGTPPDLDVQFSDDGATWYGTTVLLSPSTSDNGTAAFSVDFTAATLRYAVWEQTGFSGSSGSSAVSGLTDAVTDVRVRAGGDVAIAVWRLGGIG